MLAADRLDRAASREAGTRSREAGKAGVGRESRYGGAMKRALVFATIMGTAVVSGAPAAVTNAEMAGFKKRLEPVRASYAPAAKHLVEDLEKARDALAVEQAKARARGWQLGYLRFLLMLEEDFRLLAAPGDKIDESLAAREFSTVSGKPEI